MHIIDTNELALDLLLDLQIKKCFLLKYKGEKKLKFYSNFLVHKQCTVKKNKQAKSKLKLHVDEFKTSNK